MQGSDSCSSSALLQRFVLGLLPADELTTLAGHVEYCPLCVSTLDGLNGEDTLVADMRGAAGPAQPAGELVERLTEKLCGLSAELVETVTADLPGGGPSPPEVDAGKLEFLAPPQQGGELGRLGSYRILNVLGAGGMGVVLLAEDTLLRRAVAIKVMRPELAADQAARRRFLREAQATAAIDHPRIVPIHHVGEEQGLPFIVMPLLKGETLAARLERQKRLSIAAAVAIARQVAEGLAAAHQRGLIHRDVKPGNIWLSDDLRFPGEEREAGTTADGVKLVDFGLARALAGDDVHLTKLGTILGTPAYMAPEQARSEDVDCRCDLFSLGAVVYRMLTGELPFKGHDTMSCLAALATDTPPPVRSLNPEVPSRLNDLVMKLLAKEPGQRPHSADSVAEALGQIAGDLEGGRRPKDDQPGRPKSLRVVPIALQVAKGAGSALWALRPWAFRRPGLALAIEGAVLVVLVLLVSIPFRSGKPSLLPPAPPIFEGAETTNSVGMRLVYVPSGKFMMGSSPQDIERRINLSWVPPDFIKEEGPAHEVEITRPFYLGKFEVTVGQFRQFVQATDYKTQAEKAGGAYRNFPDGPWKLDRNTNWQNPGFEQGDDHPVVCVTWNDAVAFCTWLSQKEGRSYGLPTEAEWEYCCRAGSTTQFCCGDDDGRLKEFANLADKSIGKAWPGYPYPGSKVPWDDRYPFTAPVGTYRANAFGLHDMHGNVWEMCADWYDQDYYRRSPTQDPRGPDATGLHVIRGGSWANDETHCRSAFRHQPIPSWHSNHVVGFRVVRR